MMCKAKVAVCCELHKKKKKNKNKNKNKKKSNVSTMQNFGSLNVCYVK
jgi:hypothetical protein